jgi:hypothetical protein
VTLRVHYPGPADRRPGPGPESRWPHIPWWGGRFGARLGPDSKSRLRLPTGSLRLTPRLGDAAVGGDVAEAARNGGLERGQEPVHAVACGPGPGAARLPAGASAAVWRRRERAKG